MHFKDQIKLNCDVHSPHLSRVEESGLTLFEIILTFFEQKGNSFHLSISILFTFILV